MASTKKRTLFKALIIVTIILGSFLIRHKVVHSNLDIMPIVLSVKNHKAPLRTPGTFAENHSDTATQKEILFAGDTAFGLKYNKSKFITKPFAGVWFPLENVEIDFSEYDRVEVGIKTNKARRIPFNLSVQNKKETHQYVCNYIEVKEGVETYFLELAKFQTPDWWYRRNNVSQAEIPKQDLSQVEALSFESCQLLKPEIEDEFIVHKLILHKNITLSLVIIIILIPLSIFLFWVVLLEPFKQKTEVVHVPIERVEYKKEESLEDRVLSFLAANYTNPDLTLNDLKNEFAKGTAELSKIIKEQTKLTFPKYLSYLRIEEAKRILKSGDFKTVSEIGYIVGFNSPSNFIRVFKSQEGISPKKYLEESEKE